MSRATSPIGTRATFSPSDALPVDFAFTTAYVTELKGARIAFVEVYYDLSSDDPVKRLRTGQVGRFEIVYPDDANPADHLTIPLGVLTCISNVAEVNDAVRATFVIAQAT